MAASDEKHALSPIHETTHEESVPFEEEVHQDVTTLLEWHAPGRPFKSHSFEFYVNSFLITVAIELILFFFSQYLLMMVGLSLAFLTFALAAIPPRTFYYTISSEGIRIEDHFFIWEELYDFYFMKQHGQEVVHIRTQSYFPGELLLTLGDVPVRQIKSILLSYLPFREYVHPGFTEQASTWLEKNFPLEKPITQ